MRVPKEKIGRQLPRRSARPGAVNTKASREKVCFLKIRSGRIRTMKQKTGKPSGRVG